MYMKGLTQRKQRKILCPFSKKVHENIKMINTAGLAKRNKDKPPINMKK